MKEDLLKETIKTITTDMLTRFYYPTPSGPWHYIFLSRYKIYRKFMGGIWQRQDPFHSWLRVNIPFEHVEETENYTLPTKEQ